MMNGTISSRRSELYKSECIREAFRLFMETAHPKVKPRTLSTYCSDALFIWEQLPDSWVWDIVEGKTYSDEEWKLKIQTCIRQDITAARTCPDKDAKSYTGRFWQLILFLRIFDKIEEGRLLTPRRIGA